MIWYVFYEVRQQGAIGLFAGRLARVDADSRAIAIERAMNLLNDEGYETRFPINVFQQEFNAKEEV